MADLSVKYKNIRFNSPFIIASGPSTRNAEMIERAFKSGWDAVVTKTICLNHEQMISPSPRLSGYISDNKTAGLQNIELISDRSVNDWIKDITYLKTNYPEKIIIASISASSNDLPAWKKLSSIMHDAGADILELNLSCPHGLPEINMGKACSIADNTPEIIINAVKSSTNMPVFVKLSADFSDIAEISGRCLNNGAGGITAINTMSGFSGIDIETGLPKLNIADKSTYGGFSGSVIKPFSMRCVSEIAIINNCFISAAGGISNWQDAVEFIMLGASTVQLCTEVMFSGYPVINNLKSGLIGFMNKHSYASIEQFRGKSLKYISSYEKLDKNIKTCPEINYEICIKCGKCYVSCADAGYQAINLSSENYPEIIQKNCTGCGLCEIICPAGSIKNKFACAKYQK